MGGFGGGHSSGGSHGGFGGGHYSSNGSYSKRVFFHGRYYNYSYGSHNGKPMGFVSAIVSGVIIFLVGLFIFFLTFTNETMATITKADFAVDSNHTTYEIYEFEYNYNNQTYTGHGDDDVIYNFGEYKFRYNVGESYPLYVHFINPSWYDFEDSKYIAVIALSLTSFISGSIIISTLFTRKRRQKILSEIGDYNHDGKIDEKDIDTYSGNTNQSDINIKDFDNIAKTPVRYCKYCGNKLYENQWCESCMKKIV